jgi:alpha-beta hydrolase superfamily lysophospholipase
VISSTVRLAAARAAVVALALVVLFAGAVVYRNYRAALIDFEPWPASPVLRHPEETGVPDLAQVAFQSSDGLRLSGWYVPSRNRAAVVVTHGTNADRSSMLPELRLLAAAGFGVLAFDWPGDGASQGGIHWGRPERDALIAALTWLAARPDVDADKIGGLGFSMGGYVMTQVAAFDPRLRAVVIEAAPPDFDEYLRHLHGRWGWLGEWPAFRAVDNSGMDRAEMAPRKVIRAIAPRPLLLIGGAVDPVVSPAMIGELYAAAGEPKSLWLVPQARHGGYFQAAAPDYRARLLTFFTAGLLAGATYP